MFGSDKFIYCADAGLASYPIRKYNAMGERAYIVTQSIKKLSMSIALNAAFNLGLNKKYHRPKDLNKKLKKILK